MTRRPILSDLMKQTAAAPAPIPTSPAPAPAAPARKKTDKVQLTVYLDRPAYEQLRELAFVERCKLHDILLEGLDAAFAKRGAKPLAALKADKGAS